MDEWTTGAASVSNCVVGDTGGFGVVVGVDFVGAGADYASCSCVSCLALCQLSDRDATVSDLRRALRDRGVSSMAESTVSASRATTPAAGDRAGADSLGARAGNDPEDSEDEGERRDTILAEHDPEFAKLKATVKVMQVRVVTHCLVSLSTGGGMKDSGYRELRGGVAHNVRIRPNVLPIHRLAIASRRAVSSTLAVAGFDRAIGFVPDAPSA